ncbi:MAG: catalase-peroxidase, partial [Propionibacteriaceae bacterium]|nr:catalase-peroxidase [Propionibacteriaceae bacterium]
MSEAKEPTSAGCPFAGGSAARGDENQQWWPDRLNLRILAKNPAVENPYGEDFDYAAAFKTLDLEAVKADIKNVLTDS